MAKKNVDPGTPVTTWVPSRKWLANLVTGLGAIGTSAVTTGGWGQSEWTALIALGVANAVAYLIPNS